MSVTLIVLAWNHWELTRQCLDSLFQTDLEGAEILVVNNGSTDETAARLAERSGLRVVTLPRNLGFTGGNNAGLAAAPAGNDVVLLNNDLVFTQRDWLGRLRRCAHSAEDVGVVGCRLRLPDGRLLHAGTSILPDTAWGQQVGALEKDIGQYTVSREVEGIVFACAYLKRAVVDAIGGLATDYESYFEDTDYCLRARAAGWKTMLCGDVTLVHDEHGSTRDQPGTFEPLFARSREIFQRKWKGWAETRYTRDLLWQSIVGIPTGYAESSRAMMRALDAEGVRVAYRYVYGPGSPLPLPESLPSDHLVHVAAGRATSSRPRVSVVYGQGDVFASSKGRYKIGYTMLEVDGFPADWVRAAQEMDEVWVPSEFNRQSFLRSGLTRPVHVVPLGVDPHHFHPGISAYRNPNGEFVFLSCFEWGARKAPELLLTTFNRAFSASDPVRLVCKIVNRDTGVSLTQEIRRLGLASAGGRVSFLLNVELPHYQLASLYASADCYVSASRGEGWNMPLMEAMACGRPAISTDWSAPADFLRDDIAYRLRVRGTVPAVAKCPYYDGFSWADPDPEHLRHLLRHVFENRDDAARVGQAAAAEVASRWTWTHTARAIVARLAAAGL